MAITASDKGSGSSFEPAPPGNHPARCVSIIDLGTQEQEFQGEFSLKHQVFLMFELPDKMKTFKKDDQEVTEPFTVSGFYTLSLHEKSKLTHLLEGWRGKAFSEDEKKAFDITVLASKACLLNVLAYTKRNGETGSKIGSASQLPDGLQCKPQVHPTVVFSFEDFNQEVFDNLTDGIKAIAMKSPEYHVAVGHTMPSQPQSESPAPDIDMDSIPF
jgi:hypothetical protein